MSSPTSATRRRRSGPAAAAFAVAVLAAAPIARAKVLSEDPLAGTSTDAGVIARLYSFGFAGPILAPPYVTSDGNPTGVGIADVRLYFEKTTASFKLVVHDDVSAAFRSHANPLGLSLGRGLSPPRWLPLTFEADGDRTSLATTVDWLYAAYTRGPVTITVGRQPITFGRGTLWRPMDLVSTFSLTEVDTEYKPGADAIRVDWSAGARTSVTVVAATGELEDDHDLDASLQGTAVLARGKRSFDRGEIGGIAGWVRGDVVAGVDGVVDTGAFDLYGEATLTRVSTDSLPSPAAGAGDFVPKAVLGASWRPTGTVTLKPELLYNGFGAHRPDQYLAEAASPRVGIGEEVTLGRIYAGAVADWEATPLLHIDGLSLVNLSDPSALLSASARYNLAENVEVSAGGYVPLGALPSTSAPTQVRSEYGLFPYFFFAEIKVAI